MIARYAVPFFVIVAFFVAPLVIFFLCRYLMPRRWGKKVGICLSLLVLLFALYGMFVGYEQLEACRQPSTATVSSSSLMRISER